MRCWRANARRYTLPVYAAYANHYAQRARSTLLRAVNDAALIRLDMPLYMLSRVPMMRYRRRAIARGRRENIAQRSRVCAARLMSVVGEVISRRYVDARRSVQRAAGVENERATERAATNTPQRAEKYPRFAR